MRNLDFERRVLEAEMENQRVRLKPANSNAECFSNQALSPGLQLVVNPFWNREGPLVQDRTEHADIGSLELLLNVSRCVPTGGVRFQHKNQAIRQSPKNHGVIADIERRHVHQDIIELRP